MRNLTYVLGASGVGGLVFTLLAGIRWTFSYPDPSQAIISGVVGIAWAIMSFGFAYIYEKLDLISLTQRTYGEKLDSFVLYVNGKIKLDEWKNINK